MIRVGSWLSGCRLHASGPPLPALASASVSYPTELQVQSSLQFFWNWSLMYAAFWQLCIWPMPAAVAERRRHENLHACQESARYLFSLSSAARRVFPDCEPCLGCTDRPRARYRGTVVGSVRSGKEVRCSGVRSSCKSFFDTRTYPFVSQLKKLIRT